MEGNSSLSLKILKDFIWTFHTNSIFTITNPHITVSRCPLVLAFHSVFYTDTSPVLCICDMQMVGKHWDNISPRSPGPTPVQTHLQRCGQGAKAAPGLLSATWEPERGSEGFAQGKLGRSASSPIKQGTSAATQRPDAICSSLLLLVLQPLMEVMSLIFQGWINFQKSFESQGGMT